MTTSTITLSIAEINISPSRTSKIISSSSSSSSSSSALTSSTSSSSFLSNNDMKQTSSNKRPKISSWHAEYVQHHMTQGHIGYCYAWLDGAFCPQDMLLGKCCYKHDYPLSWTDDMQKRHQCKLMCMSALWEDYDMQLDRDGFKSKNKRSNISQDSSLKKRLRDDSYHSISTSSSLCGTSETKEGSICQSIISSDDEDDEDDDISYTSSGEEFDEDD